MAQSKKRRQVPATTGGCAKSSKRTSMTAATAIKDSPNTNQAATLLCTGAQDVNKEATKALSKRQFLSKRQIELNRINAVVEDFDKSNLRAFMMRDKRCNPNVDVEELVIEFFRFLALKVLACDVDGTELLPSGPVDSAWLSMVVFMRDYRNLCHKLLPESAEDRIIYCNPFGGDDESRSERYAQTLKMYEEVFGESPPIQFWPNEHGVVEI